VNLDREYPQTHFAAEVLEEAVNMRKDLGGKPDSTAVREVSREGDTWTLDTDEEFFGEYRRGVSSATLGITANGPDLWVFSRETRATVKVGGPDRSTIEKLIAVFDRKRDASHLPDSPSPPVLAPVVFIGHGCSMAWRDLKDHVHELHGYAVEAYETGARAGHTIRDVLDGMASRATFAVLVMTGEDFVDAGEEEAGPEMRARQNVVHEVGLFQGRLGWDRVVVTIEEGVEPFSNLQGINQLRFGKENIREVFGDVLATLRREFPDSQL
jgi:predicted nucleotide-binding protein